MHLEIFSSSFNSLLLYRVVVKILGGKMHMQCFGHFATLENAISSFICFRELFLG